MNNTRVDFGMNHPPRRLATGLPGKSQKGAVMIVALMLLLVMTILAVSGIGNSTLEQKMSGNYYNSASAFQAAEYGIRVAEQWVINDLPSNWKAQFESNSTTGIYTSKNLSTSNSNEVCKGDLDCYFDPTDEDEWCTGATTGCKLPKGFVTLGDSLEGTTLDTLDMNLTRQPQFIVEYIGPIRDTSHITMGKTLPPADREAFRITVIAWGLNGNATHTLSSHVTLPL